MLLFGTMKRMVVAVILAACGGSTPPAAGPSEAVLAKKFSLTWGIQQAASKADVFLQATDETGKQTSYPLGTYDGQCKVIAPDAAMKAVTAVSCTSGVELDAVLEAADVVVLKGTGGDPMARTEVTRITTPPGAKVDVAG